METILATTTVPHRDFRIELVDIDGVRNIRTYEGGVLSSEDAYEIDDDAGGDYLEILKSYI